VRRVRADLAAVKEGTVVAAIQFSGDAVQYMGPVGIDAAHVRVEQRADGQSPGLHVVGAVGLLQQKSVGENAELLK